MQPDSLPQDVDQLVALFADVTPRTQGFYKSTFSKTEVTPGPGYLERLAESLHRQGENLLALMIIERGLPDEQSDQANTDEGVSLLSLKIRVLHGVHSYGKARQLALSMMERIGTPNVELTGNLASVIKSEALAAGTLQHRNALMKESMGYYARCFTVPEFEGSYWLGVNALALGVCLGEDRWVREHLPGVVAECEASGDDPADFWRIATLAELSLIAYLAGDSADAASRAQVIDHYEAAERACKDLQQRKSARRNLGLMLTALANVKRDRLQGLAEALDAALRPAQVVLFTGHRVDQNDRPDARFPLSAVPEFRDALHRYLDSHAVDIGFSSAANGGDLLFIDTLLVRGITAHAILPFNEEQFRDRSVRADADDAQWQTLYDGIVSGNRQGTVVWHASQSQVDETVEDAYYAYANRVILGMGLLKAQELGGELSGLAIIEPSQDFSQVGSLSAAKQWSSSNVAVRAWRPSNREWEQFDAPETPNPAAPSGDAARVLSRTILFADVMGFSKLSEPAIAGFCEGVLGGISKLLDDVDERPLELNTWGDGVFAIFDTATGGAEFALRLCEMMKENNAGGVWPRFSLPETMSMRVSLHSAPVRCLTNPLTGKVSHWGQNVSLAARIEPITLPNEVFGSVATAALIAAEGDRSLAADFVGMVPLAKNFGSLEIFSIRRNG